MRKFKQNLWLACLIFLPAAIGSITLAGAASQAPPRQTQNQQTADERQKILEKLLQEMNKTGTQTPPQTQPQVQVPAGQQATAPAPIPSIVQRAPMASGDIRLSYDSVPLYDFITQIADMLKITPIMIDPDVKGTAHIYSSAAMSAQDVFPIFMAVLKSNNAALVKSKVGNFYKIVPISQGLKEGLEIVQELPTPVIAPQKLEGTGAGNTGAGNTGAGNTGAGNTGAGNTGAGQIKPPATPPAAGQTSANPTPPGAAGQTPATTPIEPSGRPVQTASPAGEAPRLATHIVRVEFVPIQSLIEPIKLFMTDGGVIMPYDRQNMLIITDYSDSLQKILELIHVLDNNFLDVDLIDMVEIKNNNAADVLEDLKKIFGNGKDGATGIYLTSLDRMNAIMVMANSKRALEEARRWIDKLDTKAGRSAQTFVYTVQNGTASNIAMVLSMLFGGSEDSGAGGQQQSGSSLYGGIGAGGTSSSRSQSNAGGMGGLATGVTTGARSLNSQGGAYGSAQQNFGGGMGSQGIYGGGAGYMGGQRQQIGATLNQGAGMSAQVLNAGQFSGLQGPVRIVADDLNNSLIVQGGAADYAYLLETIKTMDILPRQVIIDARIFEIELSDSYSFGVSAALQGRTPGQHLTTAQIAAETGALTASTFAFIGSAREILMNLDALRLKTKVRILEAPSVLAIDGMQAHIQVGGSVPVPGMSYVAPAGGATTGVNYQDTGTVLDIMPRISASGTVTLSIAQNVISPGAQTSLGPTFNQTSVSTTLAVKDGESVAIAGLIRESDTNARNGVPFLSDIPILGALFGRTTKSSARTELLIMITPHVIRTPDRFREMTEELKDSLRNVGKYVDEKQMQMQDDKDDARKKREDQIKKQEKKSEPPVVKKVEPPVKNETPIKKEETPAVPPPADKKK